MFSIHFCIYGFLRSRPGGLELCFLNVCPGLFHRGLPWKRVELSVENCQLRIADSIFLVLFTLRHSQISVAIGCNHFVKFYHISWLKRGEDPPAIALFPRLSRVNNLLPASHQYGSPEIAKERERRVGP
jgi:hypothetical protein